MRIGAALHIRNKAARSQNNAGANAATLVQDKQLDRKV